jgi:hypothetical protein
MNTHPLRNFRLITSLAMLAIAGASIADTDLGIIAGRHFFVTQASDSVAGHRATLAAQGKVLASIRSQAEQDGLATATSGLGNLYIGFSDEKTEGTFLWDDGWNGTFTYWNGGEPNDQGGEDYTLFNWGSNGAWNDIGGGNYRAIYTQAVPEPTSIAAIGLGLLAFAKRRKSA